LNIAGNENVVDELDWNANFDYGEDIIVEETLKR